MHSDIKRRPETPVATPSTATSLYTWLVVSLLLIGLGTLGYFLYEKDQAYTRLTLAHNQTIQELRQASATVQQLTQILEDTRDELEEIQDDYRDERNKNEEFEDQLEELNDTVSDLDKLAKIDEELLAKYSKVYFLNENYEPDRTKRIDNDWILEGKDAQYFHRSAFRFLEDMLEDAEDDDIDLRVVSAYRSFDEQNELKGQFTQIYGSGANAFSADQGYSEHQLGTAVDLTDPDTGGTYQSFADTEAYAWLLDNAHKYGFILSYPEDNEFYIFEPWHWRFVGRDLAQDLHRDEANFYDWDQREINEYLIKLFD